MFWGFTSGYGYKGTDGLCVRLGWRVGMLFFFFCEKCMRAVVWVGGEGEGEGVGEGCLLS